MRLTFFFLLTAIGFVSGVAAQDLLPPPMPENDPSALRHYPYFNNRKNLWGYSDSNGRVLIKPAFREVKGFYKGFASAKGDKGWGVIDDKGKWVIQPEYQVVDFRRNMPAFLIKKNESDNTEIIQYIIDGKLSEKRPPPDKDDVAVFMHEDLYSDERSSGEPEPKYEIRRLRNERTGKSDLGQYIIRNGKPDSLLKSISFDEFTFGEPIKKNTDRMFSLTRSNSGKVGVVSWATAYWSVQFVEPTYDSIWPYIHNNPTFYGLKNGKVALINFDEYTYKFYESPPMFDEVKNWSTVYYVVRIGDGWYRVKHFGFYLPSLRAAQTKIDPELIIRNADDIINTGGPAYYVYKKNGLVGLAVNRNALFASEGKDDWLIIEPKFTEITEMPYWFQHDARDLNFDLFEVVLKNGKKGPITTTGVLLFD